MRLNIKLQGRVENVARTLQRMGPQIEKQIRLSLLENLTKTAYSEGASDAELKAARRLTQPVKAKRK